ncbi:MAG TPA: FecR domain-containing protein [Puia sp.]|uniref:FecR family protein n=1 Tax=Puia sp. TaxID=2045100 RepID=UPI002D033A62|nr:FecR domain-containing protein [Puia sp.]HVU95324.1 FecR domain-containing protein [Puia sp.]
MMSDHDRITILLSRRLAGELTPAEEEELRLALEQDPMLQALSSALDGVTDAPPRGVTEREEQQMMERGLRQWRLRAAGLHVVGRGAEEAVPMEEVTGVKERSRRMLRIRLIRWSAAAAVVVFGTLGVFRYNKKTPPPTPMQAPVAWHEVAAKYGTRSYLDLPDGSKLWLNAGSKVQYATGKRELTLSGEGFFDIRHDPEHPFLIHAGNVVVKVLGTSLNVRAYPGDSVVETTLIDGKAEIDMPGRAIALRPSEKVTMHNGVQQVHKVVADPTYKTIIETSWVEDKLIFRKEPFREVAAKLERWYNIRIRFGNDKYLDEELTGYFKDQPIKNVMDALQLSLGFHYELAGDSILIK